GDHALYVRLFHGFYVHAICRYGQEDNRRCAKQEGEVKITMVSHASVLIEAGPIVLLTDPWFMGAVFNESWALLCPPALTPTTLQGVTHIWISHEHPDH